jgi:hypothetical protein
LEGTEDEVNELIKSSMSILVSLLLPLVDRSSPDAEPKGERDGALYVEGERSGGLYASAPAEGLPVSFSFFQLNHEDFALVDKASASAAEGMGSLLVVLLLPLLLILLLLALLVMVFLLLPLLVSRVPKVGLNPTEEEDDGNDGAVVVVVVIGGACEAYPPEGNGGGREGGSAGAPAGVKEGCPEGSPEAEEPKVLV